MLGTFQLLQNYPNPFNPSTTISFTIPARSTVLLKVFDVIGREVAVIASATLPAGSYERRWDATGIPSGAYFYQLQVNGAIETKKLLLLK